MNTNLDTPDGYERVDTRFGPIWQRIGSDPEGLAYAMAEQARMFNPVRLFFVRAIRWTERSDTWLHKHGWYVAPVCCLADFSYGCPLDQAFGHWLRRPWRLASYKRP